MAARISAETKRAVAAVAKGMTVAKAAKRYGLAVSTIYRSTLYLRLLENRRGAHAAPP